MPLLPLFGLLLALMGAPFLLAVVRMLNGDTLGIAPRLALWLIAGIVTAIAGISFQNWMELLGLNAPTLSTFGLAFLATLFTLATWPLIQATQRALGGSRVENSESFKNLVRLPVAYRCLLVLTAGVTEEVLFRSYGIGIGGNLLGGTSIALVVSLVFFVLGHYRWGLAHLLSVFWAGLVLSVLFVVTNSVVACAVTHTLVDAVGLLLAPWGMARRAKREQPGAGGA
jgi:membrane protease YdiL (CAAX protease family)